MSPISTQRAVAPALRPALPAAPAASHPLGRPPTLRSGIARSLVEQRRSQCRPRPHLPIGCTSGHRDAGLQIGGSVRRLTKDAEHVTRLHSCHVRCRRGDLNPYALAGTSPSSWRVCLFRHSDVGGPS
jgi:hypothetical protein